jgi:hypothetical protein
MDAMDKIIKRHILVSLSAAKVPAVPSVALWNIFRFIVPVLSPHSSMYTSTSSYDNCINE